MRCHPVRLFGWLTACLLLPGSASAICNAIPGATGFFRGAVGSLNRPFASPGDFVGVEVNGAICDAASPGLPSETAGLLVTVLFVPPSPGSGPPTPSSWPRTAMR